jgi:cytochrome c-type biogenesis protein CcmF
VNLGQILLWVAFLISLGSVAFYFLAERGKEKLLKGARWLFGGEALFLVLASGILLSLFLAHRFQYQYVAEYSSRDLPLFYLISAFWAGQEGTFLLWAAFGAIVGLFVMRSAREMEPGVMGVYGAIQSFLLLFLVKRGPFLLLPEVPENGRGLNPLLQDPWMVVHPPALFLGYVLLAVPFAFALASLLRRDKDGWVKRALPWTGLGSLVLGLGIILGAYWAYKTLGWGGYWGWDPVENSSFVPWVVVTALLHGLLIQRIRGSLGRTNVILASLGFLLVVYGTFLTRSGVLADFSVHSFTDLGLNGLLVSFIALFTLVALVFIAWRWRLLSSPGLAWNWKTSEPYLGLSLFLFLAIALLVLLGMSSPLLTRLAGKPYGVQTSYYQTVVAPLTALGALLLGLAALPRFVREGRAITWSFYLALILSVACGIVAWTLGVRNLLLWLLVTFSCFAVLTDILGYLRLRSRSLARIGSVISHFGVGLLLVGAVASEGYTRSQRLNLPLNKVQEALGYSFTYEGWREIPGTARGEMSVGASGKGEQFTARPQLFYSEYSQNLMKTPAIRRYPLYDLYLSPIEHYRTGEEEGQSLILKKGEEKEIQGLRVKFLKFDVSHMGEGPGVTVGAILEVAKEGKTYPVVPLFTTTTYGPKSEPVEIPGGGDVTLTQVDATSGSVVLEFHDLPGTIKEPETTNEFLALEVSLKPLINLFWLGTTLVLIGLVLSAWQRFREAAVR